MFISGRSTRHEAKKRTIDNVINDCAENAIRTLTKRNYEELYNKYKKSEEREEKTQIKNDLLLQSLNSKSIPSLIIEKTICSNVPENHEQTSRPNNDGLTWDTLHKLKWDTLREIIRTKSEDKSERIKITCNEIQQLLQAELYPSVMNVEDPEHIINHNMSTEQYYSFIISTRYSTLCKQWKNIADTRVKDELITNDIGTSLSICTYPILIPCEWVRIFCNYVEFPHRLTNRNKNDKIWKQISDKNILENKLYLSIRGNKLLRKNGDVEIDEHEVQLKTFAIDLPYHLCRFLGVFGSVLFTPTHEDSTQFKEKERFTDTQLLLHFAIKNNDNEKYEAFLNDELEFFLNNQNYITKVFGDAVDLLIQCDKQNNDTKFILNKDGEVKLNEVKIIDLHQMTPTSGSTNIRRKISPVPHDVMRVFKSFIFPDINLYRRRRTLYTSNNDIQNFYNKNFVLIKSPFGKLLNFDTQARADINAFNKEHISLNRNVHSSTTECFSVYSLYMTLLQAAYGIRIFGDPDKRSYTNMSVVINSLIGNGEEHNIPKSIYYVPVFEAFPGLFYHFFLHKPFIKFSNEDKFLDSYKNEDRKLEDILFELFENYSRSIKKLTRNNQLKTSQSECIFPDSIRWVSAQDIISLLCTCKQEIRTLMCHFIYTNKHDEYKPCSNDAETIKSWKFWYNQCRESHVLSGAPQISQTLKGTNDITDKIRCFYKTPITMELEQITLQVEQRRI